jgi:hypothetical protein
MSQFVTQYVLFTFARHYCPVDTHWNMLSSRLACGRHLVQILAVTPAIFNLLTPCSTVLLEKLTGSQPVKKFPALYGTQWFITAFTSARHLFLSWARSIQSMLPHHTSWRSILILSSHLRLGLISSIFPWGVPSKTLYTHLISPMRATFLSLPTLL